MVHLLLLLRTKPTLSVKLKALFLSNTIIEINYDIYDIILRNN